ncbi:MAG: DUF1638 domain-containing protein [Acidimicrobiia bacterium]|nr:DUF1638 domain-containing protein [Acidimicrobiia bacterium]
MPEDRLPSVFVLACGALVNEMLAVISANGWSHITVECLPAALHNTPDRIPAAVASRLDDAAGRYDRILVGYADCGTGGLLDRELEARGVERLPGAHCYEFFATTPAFTALHDAEPGTFYLTDYLTRHFDRLVMRDLGIIDHPELRDAYFGNYTRLVYLSQVPSAGLLARAQAAAELLGLAFEHRPVGYGDLGTSLESFVNAR